MSAKAKKIDREFLLTDESVNVYGYRLLTSGYMKDLYERNPIGYRMHKREDGVVLRWEDLRVDGDKVYGKPVINLSHPLGQQTADEVENGFLNAASMGRIVVLEHDESDSLKLPNQVGPTITKWYNKEISLVDIPGNANALAQLYDKDDNELNLADFITPKSKPKIDNMSLKKLVIKELNLADDADDDTLTLALKAIKDKAQKADTLAQDLADLKKNTAKKEVDSILATALKEGRITKELSDTLGADYAENPDGLRKIVAGLKPFKSLVDTLTDIDEAKIPEKYRGKSLLQLHQEDLLADVKREFPDLYDSLYRKHKGL